MYPVCPQINHELRSLVNECSNSTNEFFVMVLLSDPAGPWGVPFSADPWLEGLPAGCRPFAEDARLTCVGVSGFHLKAAAPFPNGGGQHASIQGRGYPPLAEGRIQIQSKKAVERYFSAITGGGTGRSQPLSPPPPLPRVTDLKKKLKGIGCWEDTPPHCAQSSGFMIALAITLSFCGVDFTISTSPNFQTYLAPLK